MLINTKDNKLNFRMIKIYNEIIGTKILDFNNGNLLALLDGIIINPDNGKILAFWVKSLFIPGKNTIIMSNSIVKWSKNIYIKNPDDIFEAEDSVRLLEILNKKIFFISNIVKNEKLEYLGKIYDLDFDSEKLYLRQIYLSKTFLFFKYSKRIFKYDKILKTSKDYILVKDDNFEKIENLNIELA